MSIVIYTVAQFRVGVKLDKVAGNARGGSVRRDHFDSLQIETLFNFALHYFTFFVFLLYWPFTGHLFISFALDAISGC